MLLFPAVLVGGFVIFYKARAYNNDLLIQAQSELFTPCFSSIKAGQYADAYQAYTNDVYKTNVTVDAYQKHYAEVVQKHGVITKTEVYSCDEKDMVGTSKRSQAFVRFYFADEMLYTISYVLRKSQDGKFKIEQSDRKTISTFVAEPW